MNFLFKRWIRWYILDFEKLDEMYIYRSDPAVIQNCATWIMYVSKFKQKRYLPVTLSQTQPIRQYSLSQELPEFTPSPLLTWSFSAVWSSKWRKLTPRVLRALWTFFKFLVVLVLPFFSEVPKIWEYIYLLVWSHFCIFYKAILILKVNNQPHENLLGLAFSWVNVVKNWTSF